MFPLSDEAREMIRQIPRVSGRDRIREMQRYVAKRKETPPRERTRVDQLIVSFDLTMISREILSIPFLFDLVPTAKKNIDSSIEGLRSIVEEIETVIVEIQHTIHWLGIILIGREELVTQCEEESSLRKRTFEKMVKDTHADLEKKICIVKQLQELVIKGRRALA